MGKNLDKKLVMNVMLFSINGVIIIEIITIIIKTWDNWFSITDWALASSKITMANSPTWKSDNADLKAVLPFDQNLSNRKTIIILIKKIIGKNNNI